MKAIIIRASDWDYKENKTFNSLKELQNFIINSEHSVIINAPYENGAWTITIYDDYVE